jgi:hypothetical protein
LGLDTFNPYMGINRLQESCVTRHGSSGGGIFSMTLSELAWCIRQNRMLDLFYSIVISSATNMSGRYHQANTSYWNYFWPFLNHFIVDLYQFSLFTASCFTSEMLCCQLIDSTNSRIETASNVLFRQIKLFTSFAFQKFSFINFYVTLFSTK